MLDKSRAAFEVVRPCAEPTGVANAGECDALCQQPQGARSGAWDTLLSPHLALLRLDLCLLAHARGAATATVPQQLAPRLPTAAIAL